MPNSEKPIREDDQHLLADEDTDTEVEAGFDEMLAGVSGPLCRLAQPESDFRNTAPVESPEEVVNKYAELESKLFSVRGAKYNQDGAKVPSQKAGFRIVEVEIIYSEKIDPKNKERSWIETCPQCFGARNPPQSGTRRFAFFIEIGGNKAMGIPKDATAALAIYVDEDTSVTEDDRAYSCLLEGALQPATQSASDNDVKEWNSRFKIIPIVRGGPVLLRKIVSGKPAIIGKKVETVYHDVRQGQSVTREIMWAAGTDGVAKKCCKMAIGHTQSLVLDMGVVLEGRAESELPERLLFGLRLFKPNMRLVKCVD